MSCRRKNLIECEKNAHAFPRYNEGTKVQARNFPPRFQKPGFHALRFFFFCFPTSVSIALNSLPMGYCLESVERPTFTIQTGASLPYYHMRPELRVIMVLDRCLVSQTLVIFLTACFCSLDLCPLPSTERDRDYVDP